MSLPNPKTVVTEERLNEYHNTILPYLGGMPEIVANKFSKGDLYSTEEKMIGQWIDSKPLYQKTMIFPVTSAGWNTYHHNIPNIDYVCSVKAFLRNSGKSILSMGYMESTKYAIALANASDVEVNISSAFASSWTEVVVTIQYTKTTDTAISIGSDTDYSTDEKVIGTWIGGKLLYQKTFVGKTPTAINVSENFVLFNNGNIFENIIVCNSFATDGASTPTYIQSNAEMHGWRVWANPTGIRQRLTSDGSSYLNCDAYVTIQYTKT